MIIRGSGVVGRVAIGIPGRTVVADGGAACTGAGGTEGLGVAGVAAIGTWGGAATGGVGTAGGGAGCGTVNVGRAAWLGVINRGAGGGANGGFGTELDGAAAGGAGAAATGLVSTGGVTVAGRGGTGGGAEAEGCCLLIIAFRTSPGLDMLERSILVLISSGSKRLGRAALLDTEASLVEAEVRPDLVRFMVFKGTGVGLLLGDANHWKRVEDCPALDFQLSSQIVDSNLAHPPFLTSGLSR